MTTNLFMPVRIIAGKNCISENAGLFSIGKRCLIVTGKSSAKKSGALDDIVKVLCGLGIGYTVFDRIGENPLLSVCYEGGKTASESGADFIIGIGGGSPIDAAKAIAAFAVNRDIAPEEIFDVTKLKPSLPIIAVPITAGTGSEANPYSILTLDSENRKKTFNSIFSYPRYAFLDAKYTRSLNADYSLSTALDAFCHCIESYLSPKSDSFSSLYALYGAKVIWDIITVHDFKPDNEDSAGLKENQRQALLLAACAGGIAINRTGTGFPHPLGYNLTLYHGIPHGRACGAFTGKFIEYNMRTDEGKKRLNDFAAHIGTNAEDIAAVIPRLSDVKIRIDSRTAELYINKVESAANFKNSIYILSRDEMLTIMKDLFTDGQ